MQNNNIDLNSFFSRLKYSEYWEISDPIFKNVIARKTDFENIQDAIESLENFAGQQVEIKAGKIDKNGNLANNSTRIKFFIPNKQSNQTEITIVGNNQQNNQENEFSYSLGGVETPINVNNLATTLKGIEERLEAKFLKEKYETEYYFRFQDLERREKELRANEKEIAQLKEKYEEKLNAVIPQSKDLGKKILDGLLFGILGNEKPQKPLNNTPQIEKKETKAVEFTIKNSDENTKKNDIPENKIEKLRQYFEELDEKEQNEFLNDFFEEVEEEDNKTNEVEESPETTNLNQ
ncbi:MAG: hypothetical protein JXR68_12760 [Bacteroidales bacterium]|nr:hypothetical protein [Bacteroidales bacterium]